MRWQALNKNSRIHSLLNYCVNPICALSDRFITIRVQATVPGCQRCEEDQSKDVLWWSAVSGSALQGDGETKTGGLFLCQQTHMNLSRVQRPFQSTLPFQTAVVLLLCICFVVSQRRDQGHSADGVIHPSLSQLPGFCFDVSYLIPSMFPFQPPPCD